jgi:hypothetical protein
MGNTPTAAPYGIPSTEDIIFGQVKVTGNVNPGDFLAFSGHWAVPTGIAADSSNAVAARASAAGWALEANPVYDSFGNSKQNTALLYMRQGPQRVSALYNITASANILLGTHIFPNTTGSAVNAPTGLTGVGAQWATAAVASISGNPTGAPALALGKIVAMAKVSSGSGASQYDIWSDANFAAYL